MRIDTFHWQENQPFTEQYLTHFEKVNEWFDYNPWTESSVRERADWLDHNPSIKADRERLVSVLKAYNEKFDASEEVLTSLEQLRRKDALVVVGGQQAGLFSGPLYVIYKAVTIIQTARKQQSLLGRPVLPVFWIAGEDHDWDEVNHLHSLSPKVQLEKVKLSTNPSIKAAISNVEIKTDEWEEAVAQLSETLLDTEFKAGIVSKLRDISRRSSTLVDSLSHILMWLFGRHGLILLDSHDPALRRVESKMFELLITQHAHIQDQLLQTQQQFIQRGYQPQAEVRSDNANLFIEVALERKLLTIKEGYFSDKKGQSRWTSDELLRIALNEPERFSNNVFTRPLMQEYLFPVLTTVLGPGEIAYWGLLRGAFHQIGMKMPIVMPRLQYTLIEGTIQKAMDKFDLNFSHVISGLSDKKQAWLSSQDEYQLEERFDKVKDEFSKLYTPLVEVVAKINPGLKDLGETNQAKILEQIQFLEKRAMNAFKSQFESSLRQWERIELSLIPLTKKQERVYNTISYLNKYGEHFVDKLLNIPIENPSDHAIVYL